MHFVFVCTVRPERRETRTFPHHNIARQEVTSDSPARFQLGPLDVKCTHCGSVSFRNEKRYSCCQNGKVVLNPLSPYPVELEHLLTADSDDAKNFRKYIRKYNNLFAFASTKMRQATDLPANRFGSGVIRISGHVYHKTGQLHPEAGKGMYYNHFYIYDG